MKIIKFKSTPLPRMVELKNGVLVFQCTCGKLGYIKLRNLEKTTRCSSCTKANTQYRANFTEDGLIEVFNKIKERTLTFDKRERSLNE